MRIFKIYNNKSFSSLIAISMMFSFYIRKIACALFILIIFPLSVTAQDVKSEIEKAKALIGEEKYNKAYNILKNISDSQVEELGKMYVASFNYYMGSCLYFMNHYEDAVSFLQKGINYMEKLPHASCDYLEMHYGVGVCYKKMGNYIKAEEYFRRTILKGTYTNLNCAIRKQTYTEMAELYSLMGKPDLSNICTNRMKSEISISESKNLDEQIVDLLDLYKAYEKQGKIEEGVNVYKNILRIIEDNKGKINDDYLLYSYLLSVDLRCDCKREEEAAEISKEIIEIGKNFKTYKKEVCYAYENYIRYLARKNKVDSVEQILSSAVKYCTSTKLKDRKEVNLYEDIGLCLIEAGNWEEGVKYLEMKWKGNTANSIYAYTYLGMYYSDKNLEKAILFYKKAESKMNNGFNSIDIVKRSIYDKLMLLYRKANNTIEAIKYAELAEPYIIQEDNNRHYLEHLINWSIDCLKVGNYEKANTLVEKAVPYIEQVSNETKLVSYSNIGYVYLKLELLDKAINYIDKGISLALNEMDGKCNGLATLYHNLGRAYMLKGDYIYALSALYKSKELQIKYDGKVTQRTTDYIKECESK